MLRVESKRTIGIDLAGMSKNPTGLALLEGKVVNTNLIYNDEEIWESITRNKPSLVFIEAP